MTNWNETIYLKFNSQEQSEEILFAWFSGNEPEWAAVDYVGKIYKKDEETGELQETDGFHVNIRLRIGYEIPEQILPFVVEVSNPKRMFFQ